MNKISRELLEIAKEVKALDEEVAEQKEMLDIAQKEGKKYILHHKEGGLWRIQACKNFGHVKKGDFGGLIESEENLSHDGNCWVYGRARVFCNAKVYGNAVITNGAQVYDKAQVYDNARVFDDAKVYGRAQVFDNARLTKRAKAYDNAMVFDDAWVDENAQVFGDAQVYGTSRICGRAKVDYEVEGLKGQTITE